MNYEAWLKNKDLEYRDGILYFGDINTVNLANQYGTPLYVNNEQIIRDRYKKLKNAINFEYKNNEIHFAVKANSNIAILRILKSEGASFDCTSSGEIRTCLKAGISPDKIMFTGNMFTDEDFKFAVGHDVLVNLDSISQLDRLVKIIDDLGKEKRIISFRINPEFGAGHHPHTITAGKNIKFGILDNQVIEAYTKALNLGFMKFGIHIHIGSGIINPLDFEKAIEKFFAIIANIADKLDMVFEFIDFGGGLGIPYNPKEDPLNLGDFINIVVKKFKEIVERGNVGAPQFKIEPGRYLIAEASIILAQINTIKYNGYKRFAGLNAGFNTLIRPILYGSYHHIIKCDNRNENEILTYDIVGPICESGDVLGKNRELSKLKENEYLAILDTGAYGFTMSSNYNSRTRSAEILINNGCTHIIREAEKFNDLIAHQIIPDHLK
ncbi:MAG: diaminopimelate decarboxylase [Candidatus Lokiarchaeota archaeon]|nr:diaminopimelate decarboxylase [Candidatus Lokiarchaeota archaeon]